MECFYFKWHIFSRLYSIGLEAQETHRPLAIILNNLTMPFSQSNLWILEQIVTGMNELHTRERWQEEEQT